MRVINIEPFGYGWRFRATLVQITYAHHILAYEPREVSFLTEIQGAMTTLISRVVAVRFPKKIGLAIVVRDAVVMCTDTPRRG